MGDLVGKAHLLHGCRAVAAAHDGDGAAVGQSLGHGTGALGKGVELKHAHGAVPHHGAGAANGVAENLGGFGADVQALHVVGDGVGGHHVGLGLGGELAGGHGVGGQQELHAVALGLVDHLQGVVQLVVLAQAVADGAALGLGEGVGHAAADDDGVGLLQQVVDDADLIADLGAAQDGHEGALGIVQRAAHDLQLTGHQQTADGGQVGCHTGGGGVSAVDGAEGVGHKQLRHVGQLLRQLGVVLGLALFKTGVLQQHDLAGLQRGGLGLGVGAHGVGGKDDLTAQQLAQTLGNGGQGQLLQGLLPVLTGHVGLALLGLLLDEGLKGGGGLAQVRAGDDGSALIQQIADGGQGGHDALIAGDGAGLLVLGHVEVAAQQNLLAGHIHVHDGLLVVIHTFFLLI